jgi:L-lactate dehydrogenase complex protein LldG
VDAREQFLQQVRKAVGAGNRHLGVADLPKRGDCGYQGAGLDPAARFCAELTAAGGKSYRVADIGAAREQVLAIVREKGARKVLVGGGAVVESLQLPDHFRALGIEATTVADIDEGEAAGIFFAADLSVTGADYLIAETGSVVYLSRGAEPRSASLLPPVHVVVATTNQLLPDLFDLFERLPPTTAALPACVSIITGPSKTGDIELKLVTGVHGPGELHVVLVG